MYKRARQAPHPGEIEVLQQRRGARQSPGGERGAAEFRGEPAAHPAVVRVHLAAQHQRRPEREADARQLEPGQHQQVQVVTPDGGADHRRDDVRHDGGHDQAPELRRALIGVMVALLQEQVDGIRRLEGVLRPAIGGIRQAVQVGEDHVVRLEPVPVHPANLVRRRIDDHHRLADRFGVLDDICRAAFAARGLAVPDREQHVRTIDRFDAAVQVAVLAVAVLADRAHVVRGRQEVFHRRPSRPA